MQINAHMCREIQDMVLGLLLYFKNTKLYNFFLIFLVKYEYTYIWVDKKG